MIAGGATVCLVTDSGRLADAAGVSPDRARSMLPEFVAAAARAGVTLVHVRERGIEAAVLFGLVSRCVAAVRGTDARVVVNDRADVAIAAGADGVHLREDSVAARRLRAIVPSGFLLGRSFHDPADIPHNLAELDYVVFGPVCPTRSKPAGHPVAGLHGLRAAVAAAGSVPVLAIGGVTSDNAIDLAAAGARGVAAIDAFLPHAGQVEPDAGVIQLIVRALRGESRARRPMVDASRRRAEEGSET